MSGNTNTDWLRQEALKKAPVWNTFYSKQRKKLEKMDTTVHALHHKWSARIDCLDCGNCCRSLGPRITDKDVERLAKALKIKQTAFVDAYLRTDEDGDLVFQSMPCPFLGDDNFCAVYESRPKACRDYPHTDRKKFFQLFRLSVKNAETCPIVLEVLNELSHPDMK
jgi:Fe-S-cluster containining protein